MNIKAGIKLLEEMAKQGHVGVGAREVTYYELHQILGAMQEEEGAGNAGNAGKNEISLKSRFRSILLGSSRGLDKECEYLCIEAGLHYGPIIEAVRKEGLEEGLKHIQANVHRNCYEPAYAKGKREAIEDMKFRIEAMYDDYSRNTVNDFKAALFGKD